MFKCAMAFLWSLFIAFFILLCLTSCEYEKPITPDKEFVELEISLPPNYETRATIDTVKWHEE
jgi:hypothetical protein